MRLRITVLMACGLALPLALPAQSAPNRTDLVRAWVRGATYKDAAGKVKKEESFLTLNADSTWTRVFKVNGEAQPGSNIDFFGSDEKGQWHLTGDSLWLKDPIATDTLGGDWAMQGYWGDVVKLKWLLKAVLQDGKLFMLGYYSASQPSSDGKITPVTCNTYYCFEPAP